jgi:hypothetical protein
MAFDSLQAAPAVSQATAVWYGFTIYYDNIPLPIPGVYRVTHIATGRCYIGSSRNIENRFVDGWQYVGSKKGQTQPRLLAEAFLEYGRDAFLVEPICYVFYGAALHSIETALIIAHDCLYPNGFNAVAAASPAAIFGAIAATDDLEKRRRQAIAAYAQSPYGQQELSARRKLDWSHGTMRASQAARDATPERKAQRSNIMTAAWQRPEVRERHDQTNAMPETQARRKAGGELGWADPTLREEAKERRTEWLADPDNYEATCKINQEINARPEVKQKLSDAISGLKWITNGQEEHRVPETNPIPEGWQKGRLKEGRSFGPKAGTHAYRKITDGTQNRNIGLDDPIPDGWRVGMTMKPRAKKGDAQ